MISKISHCNEKKINKAFISKIEKVLLQINLKTLVNFKSPKGKSNYIKNQIENDFKNQKIAVYAEHRPNKEIKDSVDVYIEYNNLKLIIEIDNLRADQVAKKLLSRTAMFINQDIIYVTFCYFSNSAVGHKTECLKYIKVHFKKFISIHNNIEYLAFVPSQYKNIN